MPKEAKTYHFLLVLVTSLIFLTGCSSNPSGDKMDFQTETLKTGDLTAMVIANGALRAGRSADLKWRLDGVVGPLAVKLGDEVKEGQTLVSLQNDNLPESMLTARSELYQSQKEIDELLNGNDQKAAKAYQELVSARKAFDEANKKFTWANSKQRTGNENEIEAAKTEYLSLEKQVRDTEKFDWGIHGETVKQPTKLEKKLALAKLKLKRDEARAKYEYLKGKPSEQEIQEAEANLEVAKTRLDFAKKDYEKLKGGVPEDELNAAQARLEAAKALLRQQEVVAPFDGTVTLINAREGVNAVTGDTALRIEDRSHLYVDISLSEMDVNRVRAGQPVTITFDAVFGKDYTGKVKEVSFSGNNSEGLVTYPVLIELDNPDANLRSGMTAAVHIQVEAVKNVLLIPNQAVRTVEGERVVFIITDENPLPKQVPVRLGVSSETMSQVLEGEIKAGDKIVLNPDTMLQGID